MLRLRPNLGKSLLGSISKVKAIREGRLKAVKSVIVPGKCSAISDGVWPVFPLKIQEGKKIKLSVCQCVCVSVCLSVCVCVCVNEIPTMIFYVRTLSDVSAYTCLFYMHTLSDVSTYTYYLVHY